MYAGCVPRRSSDRIICKIFQFRIESCFNLTTTIPFAIRNGHMLTHRNKKPYECKADGCGKSYCDARSLRRHTENHHSSLVLTTSTAPSQIQSSNTTSNNTNSGTSTITNPSLSPATASGRAQFLISYQLWSTRKKTFPATQRDFCSLSISPQSLKAMRVLHMVPLAYNIR